ncbi:hypothetical protein PHISCL_10149 [Aspergillus sclerotialis]|uniref:Uncharacterized protein n=1 Tax=Aspergillus sclerotialis TaxID=2070753 RepID=A0A3A2Z5Q2_9EURO|nr:hypothetical protein PHISCL_10149 [Aspergillus sclerotialis]
MSGADEACQLTEHNLQLHNRLLQRQELNIPLVTWAEKVIKQEQIHLFFRQYRFHGFDPLFHLSGDPKHQDDAHAREFIQEHPVASLKLFQQRKSMCLESPLERFLTPDGCSDTWYFAQLALAQMEIPFGSMEGMEKRKEMAEMNVLITKNNDRHRGESQEVQKNGAVHSEFTLEK